MKISVVVVEYHSLEELKKCTETIQTAFSWEVEIIASSNSCYPPTEQERIKKSIINLFGVLMIGMEVLPMQ